MPPSARGSLPEASAPPSIRRSSRGRPRDPRRRGSRTWKPSRPKEARTEPGTDPSASIQGSPRSGDIPPTSQRGRGDGVGGIEAEVEGSDQGHEIDLGLAVAAARAGEGHEVAVPVDGDRHQRVRRPLARRELVRVTGLEREAGSSVVGDDPGGRLEDAGSEAAEEALDQRDPPSVGVGGDERDRVPWDVRRLGGPTRGDP